jgi:hypothetical protein
MVNLCRSLPATETNRVSECSNHSPCRNSRSFKYLLTPFCFVSLLFTCYQLHNFLTEKNKYKVYVLQAYCTTKTGTGYGLYFQFKAASSIYNRGHKFYLEKKGGTMASNSLFSAVTPCQQSFFWGKCYLISSLFLCEPVKHEGTRLSPAVSFPRSQRSMLKIMMMLFSLTRN